MGWVGGRARYVVLLSSGCIAAPGIPGGPLQGTSISATGAYGYAVAPGKVRLHRESDGRRVRRGDHAADATNLPLSPHRVGARVGIVDWVDIAADSGFLEGGLELRAGLPEGSWPFPFAVSGALRSGEWGPLNRRQRGHREQRLRVELYPRLHQFERVRVNLIATAGISFGRRYHTLALGRLPPEPEPSFDSGEGWPTIGNWGDPSAYLLRDETRAEATLGVELRRDVLMFSVLAMPYWTTDYGATSHRHCSGCENWTIDGFEGRFGLALFISGGITWTFFRLSGAQPKTTTPR